ncbi:MAG: 50S ribosomal protein L11 methyltransferase [Pseudomonadota bacterium]
MAWQQIHIRTDDTGASPLEEHCLALGAVAITLADRGDEPVLEPAPGETPLWNQITLTALFDAAADSDLIVAALADNGVRPDDVRVERLAERNWVDEWLRDFEARDIGPRLRIVASHQVEPPDERVRVVLDPGLAFGTGTHTTTALVLEWLQQVAVDTRTVLDMGCGSGILAIAALKLGASRADGVDIDAQALTATHRNAAINAVAERLRVFAPAELPSGRYEVVVANILANTLMDMADELTARTAPGGALALTGILDAQATNVEQAYAGAFNLAPTVRRDGWALVSGVRR